MSKFEPTYKCNTCGLSFYSSEVEEHTRNHIDDGILKEIFKDKDEGESHRVESQL